MSAMLFQLSVTQTDSFRERGFALVRVPGDDLRDSEGERNLESGKKRQAGKEHYHRMPRHSF